MYRCQLHKMDGKVFHLIFDNSRPIANWITTSSTRSFSVPLLIWYNTHTHMDKRIESSEIQHTLCLNCCIAIFKVRLLYLLFFLLSVCFMSRIVYTPNNYSTIALLIVCWVFVCASFQIHFECFFVIDSTRVEFPLLCFFYVFIFNFPTSYAYNRTFIFCG